MLTRSDTVLFCLFPKDINECVTQPDICKYGGTCENLCGSYRCHCTPGNAGYNCDGGTLSALLGHFECLEKLNLSIVDQSYFLMQKIMKNNQNIIYNIATRFVV